MTEVTKIVDGAGVQHAVRDDNAVHRTGDETVNGLKTFGSTIVVPSSALKRAVADSYAYFHGGTSVRDGATITLVGSLYEGTALPAGGFDLVATDGKNETGGVSTTAHLSLSPDGFLKTISSGPLRNPRVFGQQFAMAGMPSESFVDIVIPASGGYVTLPSKDGWLAVYGTFTGDGVVSVCRTLAAHNNYGYTQRGESGERFRFVFPVGKWGNMNFSFTYSNISFYSVRFYSAMAEVV